MLPVPGGDKEWYLYAARAGLLIGVANHRRDFQPQHDRPCRDWDKPARAATVFIHNGAPSALVGCLAWRPCGESPISRMGALRQSSSSVIVRARAVCLWSYHRRLDRRGGHFGLSTNGRGYSSNRGCAKMNGAAQAPNQTVSLPPGVIILESSRKAIDFFRRREKPSPRRGRSKRTAGLGRGGGHLSAEERAALELRFDPAGSRLRRCPALKAAWDSGRATAAVSLRRLLFAKAERPTGDGCRLIGGRRRGATRPGRTL